MFKIKITTEQKEYAWKLVNECNFGNRGVFDGNKERQYTGILGEVVMADGIGFGRPLGGLGSDNGIDFIIHDMAIDLKTMGRTVDPTNNYINNLVASQVESETEMYVFASINKGTLEMTFCGFIKKENLDKYFLPKGTKRIRFDKTSFIFKVDTYEIPNKELINADSFSELTNKIHQYSL